MSDTQLLFLAVVGCVAVFYGVLVYGLAMRVKR
jgi:hypothetical protein